MENTSGLFQYGAHIDPRTVSDRVLVVAIGAFGDAGHSQRQLVDHLTNHLPSQEIGRFDLDKVLDYRDSRPMLLIEQDRVVGFDTPELTLREVTDTAGESFLLLSGPEPALQWEELSRQIDRIIDAHGVELTLITGANPMPTPHTRPVVVTRRGSSPELVPDEEPLIAQARMRSAFPFLLELRLTEAGQDVIGMSAHVPQYLTEIDYPDGAIALIEAVADSTELQLPLGELSAASTSVHQQITEQIAPHTQMAESIRMLEQQYDHFMAQRGLPPGTSDVDLPSAEQIGDEIENYLRGLNDQD